MRAAKAHINFLATWILFLTTGLLLTGCGNHHGVFEKASDGTIVLPLKKYPEYQPQILFCKDFDEETGIPEWADTIFTLNIKDWLNALVRLDSIAEDLNTSMIHLDWVGPDDKSMYTKRVDVDSAHFISSSISLSPERRTPGKYTLKVYYFRELLAYKTFHLLPEKYTNEVLAKSFLPQIEFCTKKSRKTGQCVDADSVFAIQEKGRVRAIISLLNRNAFPDRHLKFELDWIGPDGNDFYTKKIDIEPGEERSFIGSSISIPPGKREPGMYGIRLKLYGEIIARKSFTLLASN